MRPLEPPYGRLDLACWHSDAPEHEPHSLGGDDLSPIEPRHWFPERHLGQLEAKNPGTAVAFVTVANARFYPGLEALLLSLLAIYPDLSSPFVVFHDGSLTPFHQQQLATIYARVRFDVPNPDWASDLPTDSPNRERIGLLGYLNIFAFSLQNFERVIVLDSDVLIVGPLDPLWAPGEPFRAVVDCGARPYALVSSHTRRPIINSGVLSLPGWALGATFLDRIAALIRRAGQPACPLLDGFADQKIWNQLLADQPLELLPINFNCNIKYLVQYLEGCVEGLSLIHFAGPKPWLRHEQPRARSRSITDHWLWLRHYRQLLFAERLRQYRAHELASPDVGSPLGAAACDQAWLAVHPASLLEIDGDHAELHLILHSAEQFVEERPETPHWPTGWLEAIRRLAQSHSLHLWIPFGLRHRLAVLGCPEGVICHHVLLELPFSAEGGVACDGAHQLGFVPWLGSAEASMLAAVRHRLAGRTVRIVDGVPAPSPGSMGDHVSVGCSVDGSGDGSTRG
ncbi:glycosyltransferase [Aphanothece stagnina]|uniref:glycosyltransferase n=1 Tax=Aphanothece stagnina TaxID=1004305 RepID=UPI00398F2514